jgi:ABC-type bacteriocin/lantibiotic exporter with double-glycine peptidase domain
MEQEPEHFNHREDPSSEWPIEGAISLENVKMRYREGLPLVLKGVTLQIGAREKIGIVGRTGYNFSYSIFNFLFLDKYFLYNK